MHFSKCHKKPEQSFSKDTPNFRMLTKEIDEAICGKGEQKYTTLRN